MTTITEDTCSQFTGLSERELGNPFILAQRCEFTAVSGLCGASGPRSMADVRRCLDAIHDEALARGEHQTRQGAEALARGDFDAAAMWSRMANDMVRIIDAVNAMR